MKFQNLLLITLFTTLSSQAMESIPDGTYSYFNFRPPELVPSLDAITVDDSAILTSFFDSQEWDNIRWDKNEILECFLQHAIYHNAPKSLAPIRREKRRLQLGPLLRLNARMKYSNAFQSFHINLPKDVSCLIGNRGNIFHLLVQNEDHPINNRAIKTFKNLITIAIAEEITKTNDARINTFTLCMARQKAHGVNKDVRTLLRKKVFETINDEFRSPASTWGKENKQIILLSCKKVIAILKLLLREHCGSWKKGTPHNWVLFSGRFVRLRSSFNWIEKFSRARDPQILRENEFLGFLNPLKARQTVLKIAREMYPNVGI